MKFLKFNTLAFYLAQAVVGTSFLIFLQKFYGSSTVWEIALYYFMIILPGVEVFIAAAFNYTKTTLSRIIINHFLLGDAVSTAYYLYQYRNYSGELLIHNILTYTSLWLLWYGSLVFESPLALYAFSGVLVHLCIDLVVEYYEHQTLGRWFWPITRLYGYIRKHEGTHEFGRS